MALPRPYGVGPYGTGPYSRYRGAVYDVAGATGISFDAIIAGLHLTIQPDALSGITFDAWLRGLSITINPEAITEIIFNVEAVPLLSWTGWAPCETGGWQTPGPCEGGVWTPTGGCSTGTWTEARLT